MKFSNYEIGVLTPEPCRNKLDYNSKVTRPERRRSCPVQGRPTRLAGREMMLVFGKSGKAAVGLDIGSHSIKVVELARAGKNLKMTRYAIQELAPGTVVDGEVVNREHLISTITDVLRNAGIKSKNVYTAVSGRSVIVRRIPMEKMSEAQARQAIHWEAEQHIPFRIDEVSLDFKIINEEIAPGQMEVLLPAQRSPPERGSSSRSDRARAVCAPTRIRARISAR